MSGKELNNSSIKSTKGDKLAQKGNQNKNSVRVGFSQDKNNSDQVINARKGTNLDLAKSKAKKKAKMAKASRKKNKK
ncbi:MAG: hypothetical protein GY932_09660 [Arcobacter sp.]|nr:hypothetical protein [Arcobacter sp.]